MSHKTMAQVGFQPGSSVKPPKRALASFLAVCIFTRFAFSAIRTMAEYRNGRIPFNGQVHTLNTTLVDPGHDFLERHGTSECPANNGKEVFKLLQGNKQARQVAQLTC